MRNPGLIPILLAATALSGCASVKAPFQAQKAAPQMQAAILQPEPKPAPPLAAASAPQPTPVSWQMKPIPNPTRTPEAADPTARVARANAAARIQPSQDGYVNAVQVYPFTDGGLFQVYAAPQQITDIMLQEGESLAGSGPVAAGDTVRWIIGDTASGSGSNRRVHILVKPTRANIQTNLIINTDRRTYHLELRATPATYMASVSWRYPQDELLALQAATAEEAAVVPNVAVDSLNFGYRLEGDKPTWRPLRVFDDGRQVFVEFPDGIEQSEMPPLFVVGADGKSSDLVNYRVRGHRMIIDRMFSMAELRLGDRRSSQRVRIVRTASR